MPSVSEPTTVEEAAAVLAGATAARTRVSIEREGGEIIVSTARLDRVLAHAWGDLTVTVEAGVRLATLAARLAEHGQMLALDPPGDPTVGACIAGSLSGPRRHRYGSPRDLVLGVTLVLADGTVASSGGTVVKNVAGYDLGKLLTGSRGTLGLIARASLRLHPRPDVARTVVAEVDGPDDAWRRVRSLQRSGLVPSAVDLLWPGRLALLFEGGERAVEAEVDRAVELVGGSDDGDGVWREIAARQHAARGRLSFAPGELPRVLTGLPEAVVRVAPGVAYVAEPVEAPLDERLRRLNERVRREFDPAGILVD